MLHVIVNGVISLLNRPPAGRLITINPALIISFMLAAAIVWTIDYWIHAMNHIESMQTDRSAFRSPHDSGRWWSAALD
jgi:cellobiose-specific phosphotransferase system component IIC